MFLSTLVCDSNMLCSLNSAYLIGWHARCLERTAPGEQAVFPRLIPCAQVHRLSVRGGIQKHRFYREHSIKTGSILQRPSWIFSVYLPRHIHLYPLPLHSSSISPSFPRQPGHTGSSPDTFLTTANLHLHQSLAQELHLGEMGIDLWALVL